MSAITLLLVEDDPNVASTLAERLGEEGFAVTHAGSVAAAREGAGAAGTLPPRCWTWACPMATASRSARHLREVSPATAMLFLTAWNSPEDRIRGLELGADDYMAKPFALRELVLRIHNMLKRAGEITAQSPAASGPVRIGIATVDFERFTADSGGTLHRLTHKECAVLRLLLESAGRAVSRDEILSRAWAQDEFPTERTVDNFILRLRRLVEQDPANPATIRSIRGVGYQLENT